jgi:outer membrane protein assembly factor BamA
VLIIEEVDTKKKYTFQSFTKEKLRKKIIKKQLKCISKGYPLASVDSIEYMGDTIKASIFIGPQIPFVKLVMDETCANVFRKISKKPRIPIATGQYLGKTCRELLAHCVNEGYPFAKVHTEQLDFNNKIPTVQLKLAKGPFYTIGTLVIKGDSSVKEKMISSVIGLKSGAPFNQSTIDQVSLRIKLNGCLEEIKPAELLFNQQSVDFYVYVRSKKISSINGALGLQPNTQTSRLSLTGDLNLKLQNTLKRGELIQLNWRRPQVQAQQITGLFNLPFLFGSPFGLETNMYLYRRDSTFLDVRTQQSVTYLLSNGFTLKAFYQFSGSNLLAGASSNPSFSSLSNTRSNMYGLNLSKKTLDYIPNPSKGYSFTLDTGIGARKSRASDTLEWNQQTTYKAAISMEYYFPLYKRHVMKIHIRGSYYFAPIIFQNEALRLGGLGTLRGFNEEELFTTSSILNTLEYRYLLDRNSALFAFFDIAYYENAAANKVKDIPLGFGGGFSFGTNLGIFSISYGLGKQFDNPILLRNGKVHFGYVAFF